MSKSLSNEINIKNLLMEHSPDVMRLVVLSTSYRKKLEYSDEAMVQSKSFLSKFQSLMTSLDIALNPTGKPAVSNRYGTFEDQLFSE